VVVPLGTSGGERLSTMGWTVPNFGQGGGGGALGKDGIFLDMHLVQLLFAKQSRQSCQEFFILKGKFIWTPYWWQKPHWFKPNEQKS
jgi:hypothetical protein